MINIVATLLAVSAISLTNGDEVDHRETTAVGNIKPWVSQCTICPNAGLTAGNSTYTPANKAQLQDPRNAGKTAIISQSFDISGAVLAPGQIILPNGGALSGTGVMLNGARIILNGQQAFDPGLRLATRYPECMSPELFGATQAADDSAALEAMVLNADYGTGEAGVTYAQNSQIIIPKETRTFKWVGNNTRIAANYNTGDNLDFLWETNGLRWEICNLEVDGRSTAENGFRIEGADFYMENLYMHDFVGDSPTDRAIGISHYWDSNLAKDTRIYNSRFIHFETPDDHNPTNGQGLTRGLLVWVVDTTNPNPEEVVYDIRDCTFASNYGEGEGIHFFAMTSEQEDHDFIWKVDNCTFYDNSRRDIKMQTSGLQLTNSTLTKIDSQSKWAVNTTTNVGVSLKHNPQANKFHRNCVIKGNTFEVHNKDDEAAPSTFLTLSYTKDALVEDNSFARSHANYQAGISLQGITEGLVVRNNTFKNCGIYAGDVPVTGDQLVENNQFEYTAYTTAYEQCGLITTASTLSAWDGLTFKNNRAQIDFPDSNAAGKWQGVIWLRWHTNGMTNALIHQNTITYSGPYRGNEKFLFTPGDFGASNVISDNRVTGITPSNALEVQGKDKGFINQNNRDEQGGALTKAANNGQ